jgi:hypothetical protein
MTNLPKTTLSLILFLIVPFTHHLNAQEIIFEDNTDNKGNVEWQWRVSVGEVMFDKPVVATYKIKNTSDKPLIINDIVAGCHCTVIEFPKDPINPNTTAYIKATFDAKREGRFYKLIRVFTNFDPIRPVLLAMEGTVKARHN